jgi:hypothetical protein
MSIVPSTWPSMVMSSELVNVPWNFTDLPTHATTRRSSAGMGGVTGDTLGAGAGAAFGWSVTLSRVHMGCSSRLGPRPLVCRFETAPAARRVPAATVGQSVIRRASTDQN